MGLGVRLEKAKRTKRWGQKIWLDAEGWDGGRGQPGGRALLTFSSYGHQLDPLAGYEVQGLVDIGDLVHPHFASLRLGQTFT